MQISRTMKTMHLCLLPGRLTLPGPSSQWLWQLPALTASACCPASPGGRNCSIHNLGDALESAKGTATCLELVWIRPMPTKSLDCSAQTMQRSPKISRACANSWGNPIFLPNRQCILLAPTANRGPKPAVSQRHPADGLGAPDTLRTPNHRVWSGAGKLPE